MDLTLLKELTAVYGPSGREQQIAECLMELLREKGLEPRQDNMGNVIVRVGGSGKKIVFMAHMDTIGLMLTRVDKDGYGYFTNIGWLDAAMIAHRMVVFENGVKASICIRDDKVGKEIKLKDLYLDFGTKTREETEELVSVGEIAVYQPEFHVQGDRIMASYLDNRSGCAILISALDHIRELKNEVYFVFSAQEEVGTRGAAPAAYGIDGAWGIAVDVTAVDDVPGSIHDGTASLGKGAGIKVLDRRAMSRPEVIASMEKAAKRQNLATQNEIMIGGGTDAGPMAEVRSGMAVGGVSLPCRYIHAPVEICDINDLEACVKLVTALAETEL